MMKNNIIIITIDCLRYDRLGCYGYLRDITQNIDAVSSSGNIYLNAFSHGGGTPEAFPSIFTSTLPPILPSEYKHIIKNNLTIAEILKSKGYNTAAFHSNPYLSHYYNYDKGFNTFKDIKTANIKPSPTNNLFRKIMDNRVSTVLKWEPPIARAKDTSNNAIQWVQQQKKPYLLWVHYMDLHRPRMPPKSYIKKYYTKRWMTYKFIKITQKIRKNELLSSDEKRLMDDMYDASLNYVDDEIKNLLSYIKHNESLYIITSDHGELLGEHGIYDHGELYEETIHVPLIINNPVNQKQNKIHETVTHLDIVPTILDFLQIDHNYQLYGTSILGTNKDQYKEREYVLSIAINNIKHIRKISVRSKTHKYIITDDLKTNDTLSQEYYNLETNKKEMNNIYDIKNEHITKYKSELKKFLLQKLSH